MKRISNNTANGAYSSFLKMFTKKYEKAFPETEIKINKKKIPRKKSLDNKSFTKIVK